MPPADQASRYELNRNVRMALTRHDVDLQKIDYSCTASTVYLYGELVRSERDFTAKEIENIIREIYALRNVSNIQLDFKNWVVITSGSSWQITKKKSTITRAASQSGTLADSTVVIDKAEKLSDVLDDLAPDSKKNKDDGSNNPK